MIFYLIYFAHIVFGCVYPGTCTPPESQFQFISHIGPPRMEWEQNGGYCGANAVQMAALSWGIYLSQDYIREHAPAPPIEVVREWDTALPINGHEIIHSNIDGMFKNVKINVNRWNWEKTNNTLLYLEYLFNSLIQRHPVVWFVMAKGDPHSAAVDGSGDGGGQYDHSEPLFGLYTNSTEFSSDAVIEFASEQDFDHYYRSLQSLPDTHEMNGNCREAIAGIGFNEMYPCVDSTGPNYGWAVEGMVDPKRRALRVWLDVHSHMEPNFLEGEEVAHFPATIRSDTPLIPGARYMLLRFDGSENVPTDSDFENGAFTSQHIFTATSDKYAYDDPLTILSSSAVYYVLIPYPEESSIVSSALQSGAFISILLFVVFGLGPIFIASLLEPFMKRIQVEETIPLLSKQV